MYNVRERSEVLYPASSEAHEVTTCSDILDISFSEERKVGAVRDERCVKVGGFIFYFFPTRRGE